MIYRLRKRRYEFGMLLSMDLSVRDKLRLILTAISSIVRGNNLIFYVPGNKIDFIRRK